MMNSAEKISGFSDRPDGMVRSRALVAAGPFEVSEVRAADETNSLSGALLTGLLVVYPLLATVAAVVVGLTLSGRVV